MKTVPVGKTECQLLLGNFGRAIRRDPVYSSSVGCHSCIGYHGHDLFSRPNFSLSAFRSFASISSSGFFSTALDSAVARPLLTLSCSNS